MDQTDVSRAVDILTQRILSAGQVLGGIKQVEIVPHAVAGHYVCRVQLDAQTNRDAFKRLFNGTAVGNSVYFTETAPA